MILSNMAQRQYATYTAVQIYPEIKSRIDDVKKPGETYNEMVLRLLEEAGY